MYKIEIWRFHVIHETYTSNNIKDILKWFRNNWQISYEYGNCSFEVYKNGKELSFDELNKIGFFVSFEELDEEEEQMPKTYKGYELVQAIAGGKIKEDTKFLAKCQVMYWDGNNIVFKSNPNTTLSLLQLANAEFVLLDEEIDIQEIEEYEFPSYADKLTTIENKLLELINENRKAIKQLDRKIKGGNTNV